MAKSAIGQAAAAAVAERKGTPLPTPSKNTGSGGSSSGGGSSIAQAAANAVAERKQTSTTPTPLPSASTPKNNYAEQQAKLAEATRKAQQAYDDYAAEARIYQKNYGKESEKAKELKAQLNDARIAERDAKNENAINSFAAMASQYKDDKAKKSDIDTFRSTELSDGIRAKEGNYAWKMDTYKAMSDQEVDVYNRLAKNGKEKEAKEFLEALTPYLNARVTKSRTEASVDQSKGFLGGVGASLASSLLKPIAAIEGGIKAGLDFKQGKAIDTAAPEYFASNLSNSLRTSVAQRIEQGVYESTVGDYTYDKQGNRQLTSEGEARNNGKIAAFLYSSGMSIADMMVMMPFGVTGMKLMMSSNAGVDTMLSAKNVGASDEQAMSLGLIAAAAEWIFEKYSIENLFHGNVSASTGAAMLKQAGIEGSEELFTEITNIIANESIMGSLSDYNLAVAEYVKMGLAPQDARNEALKEILLRLPQAFAGGLISGGIMGGVADISRTNAAGVNAIDTYLGNEFDDHLTDYTKKAREEAMAAYLETGMTQAEAERAVAEDREDISKRASEMREEERNAYVSDKTRRAEAEAMLTEAYREDASDREGIAGKVAKNKGSLGRQVMANTDADIADAVEAAKAKYEAEGKTPDQVKSLTKRFEKDLRYLTAKAQNAASPGGRMYWSDKYNDLIKSIEMTEDTETAADVVDEVKYPTKAEKKVRLFESRIAKETARLNELENKNSYEAMQIKENIRKLRSELRSWERAVEAREDLDRKTGKAEAPRTLPKTFAEGLPSRPQATATEQYDRTSEQIRRVSDDIYELRRQIKKAANPQVKASLQKSLDALLEQRNSMTINTGITAPVRAMPGVTVAGEHKAGDFGSAKASNKPDTNGVIRDFARTLTANQRNTVGVLDQFSRSLGRSIRLVENLNADGSYNVKDKNGNYVKGNVNGLFNRATGEYFISLNSMGEGYTYIAMHESVHDIAKNAAEEYAKLQEVVFEELEQHGYDVAQMIIDRMEQYGETEAVAIEEVLANTVPSILRDAETANQLVDRILEADEQTKSTFLRFIDTLKEYFEMAYNALKGSKDWKQMDAISKDLEAVDRIREQYLQGLEAIKAQNTETSTEEQNVAASKMNVNIEEDGTVDARFSRSTWNDSVYQKDKESAAKAIAQATGKSVEQATKYIDDINSIANIIASDAVRLDYEASPFGSAWKSNAEYGGSVDMSTLCKKRRLYTGTVSEIQRMRPNMVMTAQDLVRIRSLMMDKGYEVACGFCYVESSRKDIGTYTAQFLEKYAAEHPDSTYTMVDFNTPEGLENIHSTDPAAYKAYEEFMNSLNQRKPKLFENRTEYRHEILDEFKRKDTIDKKNRNGGIRFQSFSDFEIPHLIDMMQVIIDMSQVGLSGHGYTKVPDFALALGKTGLKINLSLVGDVDSNGQLIFDDVEGMPIADAMRIRNMYSENVGTILVGKSDAHILAAMADDRIDYIIPFHRSQWNKELYDALGITGFEDFTKMQNESWIHPEEHLTSGGKKKRPANFVPSEYWDYTKSGKENAETYLKKCAEDGRIPKFSRYLHNNGDGSWSLQEDGSTDGYWKLLIDYKMYDNNGKGVPMQPVVPEFNMEESIRMLNEYKGGHAAFPIADDIVQEFLAEKGEDDDLRASPRLPADFKSKHDTEANKREVASMESVYDIKGTEFPKGEVDLVTQVSNYFDSIGNAAISPDLGRIVLDRRSAKTDIGHGIGRAKAAAFAAVPAVIEQGKIVDIQYNWKGRGYDTVVVAAPVTYNGQAAVEGVVLRKNTREDDFYLHEIAIENASVFKTRADVKEQRNSGTDAFPVFSILQEISNINSDIRSSRIDLDKHPNARDLGKINAPDPDIGSIRIEANGRNEYQQAFIDDFNRRHVTPAEPANTTSYTTNKLPPHITAALRDKKRIEREYNALKESTHLSSDEMDALDALYKGGYSLDEAIQAVRAKYSGINVSEAADYYNMYERYMDNQRAVSNFNRQRKAELFEAAQGYTSDAINWQDKKTGIQYARETMERNNFDIMSHDEAEAINSQYFTPVHENEANNTRWKKDLTKRMNDLKLNKWESKYVHALINEQDLTQNRMGKAGVQEALDYTHNAMNKLLKSHGQLIDVKKCRNAVPKVLEIFRDIYTDLTDAEIRNGYAATEFYNTYAPNISDDSNLGFFERIAQSLGFEQGDMRLPTDLAGLTAGFKPGKPWFQYSLSRHNHMTAFDIHKAFDQYIRGAGNVVWHTDDIQRLRSLETAIRYQFSEEGIRKQIMQVLQDGTLDPDEQFEKIQQLSRSNKNLGNYVTNLTEYTNLLAGKKSIHDRGAESDFGRAIYRIMNNVQGRVAGNVIGGNISVALSNFIPLTQALSGIRADSLAKAMLEAGGSFVKDDGFDNQSNFLTNRQNVKGTYRTAMTYVDDALSVPFNAIDRFVSSSMVRARYAENIERGMSHEEAMLNADTWAASVIADRSKGALPTIFGRTNPIAKLFNMFQVEANNQLSYMAKDVVRDTKELNPTASTGQIATFVAGRLFAMFLAAFGYNKLREYVGLTENAFDPLSWIEDVYGEVEKYKEGDQTRYDTVKNITKETADQIPFVGGFLGGEGRYSVVQSALPKVGDIIQAYETDQQNEAGGKYFKSVLSKELQKPLFYYLLPTAGGQIKKTKDGLVTVIKGGSETVNKQGETILQYPVEKSAGNLVKAAVFGKSTLPEAKAWVESGFDSLSPKQTEMYREFEGAGGETMDFITYQKRYDELTKEIGKSNKQISEKTKEIAAANPMLTDAEAKERAQKMLGLEYRNADNEFMLEIQNSSMTDLQKLAAISAIGYSDEQIDTIRGLMDNGISVSDYLKYDRFYRDRGNTYTEDKNALVSALMADNSLSESQKTMLANKLIDGDWIVDFSSQAANDILTKHGKNAYANYKEAKAEGGLTAETYLQYENTVDRLISDYDAYGTSISYSKKAKIVNYLDSLNIPETQKEWMFYNLFGYTSKYEARHKSLKQIDGVWCYNHDGKWIKPSY